MTKPTSKRPEKLRTPQTTTNRRRKSGSAACKPPSARQTRGRSTRLDLDNVAQAGKRPDTKQAQVIAMLQAPEGITIDAVMRMTGWQQHSVRGFFAGVVRKRLGLDLRSDRDEAGARVYRICDRAFPAKTQPNVSGPG